MPEKVKVLVVDDSAFARSVIAKRLEADPEIEVVGQARDGLDALEKVQNLHPNVVTMDVNMPRMDGLTALENIMKESPTPVVMLSALTSGQAQTTIDALERGAVDFFLKPSALSAANTGGIADELVAKVKAASQINGARLKHMARWNRSRLKKTTAPISAAARLNRVVVVGASTGGPLAVYEFLAGLPASLPGAVLLVQHMPPTFTTSLARRLNEGSPLDVKEAAAGDQVKAGQVLVAPGGYHLIVTRDGEVALDQGPQECGVRPSVNVTMQSAVQVYGKMVLGVVLTGMGHDGTRGAALIKEAGGQVLAEHESTCTIYGMPRSVIEAGSADLVLPLSKMAPEVSRLCSVASRRPGTGGG